MASNRHFTRIDAIFKDKAAEAAPSAQDVICAKALSSTFLRRLPMAIQTKLRNSVWSEIPARQGHLFRYQHKAQFWLLNKKCWQQVSYAAYSVHTGERYGFAPYQALALDEPQQSYAGSSAYDTSFVNARLHAIKQQQERQYWEIHALKAMAGVHSSPEQGLNQTFVNKRFLGDSVNSSDALVLGSTVFISKPANGANIVLTRSKHVYMRFSQHIFRQGDTPASVAKQYTGQSDPKIIYNHNFNRGITYHNPPKVDDSIKVPSGWDVRVEGSSANARLVELTWQGPSSGVSYFEAPKAPPDQHHFWATRLALAPGRFTLTAKVDGASHSIDIDVQDVKTTEALEQYELSSSFAREQLYLLAEQLAEAPFIAIMVTTFGTDIPMSAYSRLYELASDKELPEIAIIVQEGLVEGHLGAFDNAQDKILVAKQIVKSSIQSNDDKTTLMALLLEEYGHSIDLHLRNKLSQVGGDAKNDEGAKFAYQLLSLNSLLSDYINFAQVVAPEYAGDLIIDITEIASALRQVGEQAQNNDGKLANLEFFGAGTGDDSNPASYGHRSIEFVLAQTGFDRDEELPKIYFGNWLRDYSQFVDPALVRPADSVLKKLQDSDLTLPALDSLRLSREALTDLVALLAGKEFSQFGEAMGTYCYKHVTPTTLGVYRPEEHIDNPVLAKNGEFDNSQLDPSFTAPYTAAQVDVNTVTGLKNYINTPVPGQAFDTAVQYMSKQFQLAMQLGKTDQGLLHFGQGLHVLEDYFSHSNYVEVCLIKLGTQNKLKSAVLNELARNIYAVVPAASSNERLPIVTGRFGQTDVLASIGPKLAGLFQASFEDYEKAEPGKPTPAEIAIRIVLKDLASAQKADSKKAGSNYTGLDYADYLAKYEKLLLWRDELLKTKNEVMSQLLLKTLHYVGQTFVVVANFAIHHLIETVAHNIDDAQTLLTEVSENPTHSQLAKDHDVHPFHELAALMAMEAVETVGRSLNLYWQGDKNQKPIQLASDAIQHPLDSDLFDQIAIDWANNNEAKLKQGTFASGIHEQHAHLTEKAAELRKELEGLNQHMFKSFNYLRSYFE